MDGRRGEMTITFGLLVFILLIGCPLSGFIYASHKKGDKDPLGMNYLQGAIMFAMVIAILEVINFIMKSGSL